MKVWTVNELWDEASVDHPDRFHNLELHQMGSVRQGVAAACHFFSSEQFRRFRELSNLLSLQPTSVRYIHPHHHRPQHQPPACTLRTIHGRPFLRPRFGLVCPPRSPSWRSPPLSVSHRQNPIPQNPLQNLPGSATAPHSKPALPNVLEVTVQPRMETLVATGGGKQMASLVVARTDGSLREIRRPTKTIRE